MWDLYRSGDDPRRAPKAKRHLSPTGRASNIVNHNKLNAVGKPVAYSLHPEGNPLLLAANDSSIARRAAFTTRHLWVTPFDKSDRYPTGDYVNQHSDGAGLPAFTAGDRSVENTDVVVWHTLGLTHTPRVEDWPVMPVDYTGFKMKPDGFFDRNPTLNGLNAFSERAFDEPLSESRVGDRLVGITEQTGSGWSCHQFGPG